MPEFGSGSGLTGEVLLTAEEERFGYLYSVMNGLKGRNFICWRAGPVDGLSRDQRRKNQEAILRDVLDLLRLLKRS